MENMMKISLYEKLVESLHECRVSTHIKDGPNPLDFHFEMSFDVPKFEEVLNHLRALSILHEYDDMLLAEINLYGPCRKNWEWVQNESDPFWSIPSVDDWKKILECPIVGYNKDVHIEAWKTYWTSTISPTGRPIIIAVKSDSFNFREVEPKEEHEVYYIKKTHRIVEARQFAEKEKK